MKELYKDIREAVEFYFDKKLRKSSYYGDQNIWDMVEQTIDEMQDVASIWNKRVDNYIEDCEADYLPTTTEMQNAYDQFREDQLSN